MPIIVTFNPSLRAKIGAKGTGFEQTTTTSKRFSLQGKKDDKKDYSYSTSQWTRFRIGTREDYDDKRAKACGGFPSSRPSSWLPHHTRTHSSLTAESRFHASHDARESWTGPGSSWSFLLFIPLLGLVNCILLGLASLGRHLQRYSLQESIGAWRGGPAWLRHIRHKSHYLDPDCLIGNKLHQGS